VKAAIVGMGSIGARHARILSELGCQVTVVSRRDSSDYPVYESVLAVMDAVRPDYIVIANSTADHAETLSEIEALGFRGKVLVEKPLFDMPRVLPDIPGAEIFVGYNLRFHPVLGALRDRLVNQRILSVNIYVGQYLPDWRPGSDYRTSYSASHERGGGVLRDISHELDYLCWLAGPWRSVAALSGHVSSLEIDSEDAAALLIETERCPIACVQLSYLDRNARRELIVNTDTETISVDLITGEMTPSIAGLSLRMDRDSTYRAQHEAVLEGDSGMLCGLNEGLETVRLIDSAERAAATRRWVRR